MQYVQNADSSSIKSVSTGGNVVVTNGNEGDANHFYTQTGVSYNM